MFLGQLIYIAGEVSPFPKKTADLHISHNKKMQYLWYIHFAVTMMRIMCGIICRVSGELFLNAAVCLVKCSKPVWCTGIFSSAQKWHKWPCSTNASCTWNVSYQLSQWMIGCFMVYRGHAAPQVFQEASCSTVTENQQSSYFTMNLARLSIYCGTLVSGGLLNSQ